jgi:microcystin-dependent protein
MSEPFVGEIRMFAGDFAPRGWASCDGQLLAVSQNDALFSLLGTIHGGDGRTTFGLPDMRGRIPIHAGDGPALSVRQLGQKGGQERVTITQPELPAHSHDARASTNSATDNQPEGKVVSSSSATSRFVETTPTHNMASTVLDAGGSQPHDNLMPYLCVNFIIALFGIYPSRN